MDGVQNSPDPSSVHLRCQRQLPAHFREDGDSDENDGVLCAICQSNEPDGLPGKIVFWVDCDECGVWVHNYCAFGKNIVTRKFLCENCLNS